MSKIAKAFENKKAFIPFVTAGDPTLDVTEQLLYDMQKAGADLKSEFRFQTRQQKDQSFRRQMKERLLKDAQRIKFLIC